MEEKNPYTDMPKDVLDTHLKQLSAVVKEKEIDITQVFSIPKVSISKDDQEKIDQYASLTSQVETLTAAESAKNLSDVEAKLAKSNFERVVSDLKKIDENVPLASLIGTKFNNLDKADILSGVVPIVEHYKAAEATLRKEIGDKPATDVTQQFSEPASTGTSDDIIKELVKANEVSA